MPFVDVLNKTQELLKRVIGNEQQSINTNHEYRFIIVDEKECFEPLERSLSLHSNDEKNISVYRVSNSIDYSECVNIVEAGYNNRIHIAIIAENGENEITNHILSLLFDQVSKKYAITKLDAKLFLKIDIFYIFDVNCIITGNCRTSAQKLAPILHNLATDRRYFPDLRVVHTVLPDGEPQVQQAQLSDQILYIEVSDKTSFFLPDDKNDCKEYKLEDYPWISFRVAETHSPELLLFTWIHTYLSHEISTDFSSVCDLMLSIGNSAKEEFLNRIGYMALEDLNTNFSNWLGYVPVEITKEEWDRYEDTVSINSVKTRKERLFFGIKRSIKESVVHQEFKGTPTNTNPDILKRIFKSYITSIINTEDFCYLLLEQLSGIAKNVTESEIVPLVDIMIKITNEVFYVKEDTYGLWREIGEYYKNGLSKKLVYNCYNKMLHVLQETIHMFEFQINNWSNEATAPSVKLNSNQIKLYLRNDMNKYLDQIIQTLDKCMKDEEFCNNYRNLWNSIDNKKLSVIAHLPHILVNDDYLIHEKSKTKNVDYSNTALKNRTCFYLALDSLNKMID